MLKTNLQFMLASLGLGAILGSTTAYAQNVVHTGPHPGAAAIHAYWTPERMRSAQPAVVQAPSSRPAIPSSAPLPPGSPGAAGGSLPTVGDLAPKNGAAPLSPPSVPQPPSTPPPMASGSYPGPHTTYAYGPKFRVYPLSTVGVLFFTPAGGGNAYCTATVTTGTASIQNIIWTAGHCVSNGAGAFHSNWLFCPSYDSNQGGENPNVGCWSWSFATTTSAWFNSGSFSKDYALIALAHSGDKHATDVGNVTGSVGFAWNFAVDQAWHHYGYPQDAWVFGEMVATTTEYRYSVTTDANGPAVNSWGSAQTHGASGSAVLLNFCYYSESGGPACGAPDINSNVSFLYDAEFGHELQGPYFDTAACQFWQGSTGWPGTC
jgi:hypothetical protein